MEFLAANGKYLFLLIHNHIRAAGYAAGSHSTGHNRCMAGHTAPDR